MSIANRVSVPQPRLSGTVILEPSKSLSNRALIIRSLCDQPFEIHHLSTSDDTVVLQKMLSATDSKLFAGHAGSSYRFMVARACLGKSEVVLEATPQLSRRPIGPLVRALQNLGADITYLKKDGFPPLSIKPSADFGVKSNEVTLHAGISSQYISAILMIAPCLPNGLTLHLTEDPVSVSYVHMTLRMMEYFGITTSFTGNTIRIEPGHYVAKEIAIEGDWSAASYYYSCAALAESATIEIEGLKELSLQGDQVVRLIYEGLGVTTHFHEKGITLIKVKAKVKAKTEAIPEAKVKADLFQYDFSSCPDIAQTVMVTLAGLGIKSELSGLKTLRIKETDRIAAMQTELARVKTGLEVKEQDGNISCKLFGKAKWKDRANFNTYEDHRMAMAFTPLACLHPIMIKNPDVVSKSYPGFWRDMESIGVKSDRIKVK
jgi:3-phosphoshikimate 1-carboxyvinyltransferase